MYIYIYICVCVCVFMCIYSHYMGCFPENCECHLVWLYLRKYVALVTLSTFVEIW